MKEENKKTNTTVTQNSSRGVVGRGGMRRTVAYHNLRRKP